MTTQEPCLQQPLCVTQHSTPGKALLFLTSMGVAVLAHDWWTVPALGIVLLLNGLPARHTTAANRGGHIRMRKWFLPLFFVTTVLVGLFLGPADTEIVGVNISTTGLATAVQMVLRVVTITIAVSHFTSSVSVSELTGLFECVGLKGLGFALGVAFNMLPTTYSLITTSFYSLRLRGGFRRNRLRSLRLLLVTVVDNALQHADEIVAAAESRAFTVDRIRPIRLVWEPRDLLSGGLLLALTIVFIFV